MAIKFVSPLGEVQRRDYPLASGSDQTYFTANPNGATGASDPVVVDAGLFGALSSGKLVVAGGDGNLVAADVDSGSGTICMLIITQKGDYTAQAINKVTCITHGGLDIRTNIYDSSDIPAANEYVGIKSGKLTPTSTSADKLIVGQCISGADSAGYIEVRLFATPIQSK